MTRFLFFYLFHESARVAQQKATEEAKRQAQLAIQRAEEMHRLYLGAEKKIEVSQ